LSVNKDDYILVDYVAKIKETNEVFDTTMVEEAKKGGVFKDNSVYEPMFIVVGKNWVLKKLDNSIIGLKVGEKAVIEIPPEDGFGLRDPAKVKVLPLTRFRKQDVRPYPGAQIEIDGKTAVVRSIGAGRVQVDFNSPLAGKTLVYDLTVGKKLEDKLEKIKALIHRRIPTVDAEKFKLDVDDNEITIEVPEEAYSLQGMEFAKRGIASDLEAFFPFEKIVFTEVFIKPSPQTSEEPQKQADDLTGTQPSP
jgi:peptidylprolyl isomerase